MSYGKFAPKLKINNNPYYGNSWDAIGYAIGNALGNLWGANYNQRGIEKGEAEAQEALQKAYNKVYGNTQPAPESLQTQYEDVTGKMGVPQGQQGVPQSKDAATYIDTTKKYLGNNNKTDTTGKTMKDMIPQRDIKAEKFDTFMSKYNSGTPNPDGDAQKVDALTQAANGNLANMDFSKLPSMSAEDLQSAIRKELRANGRTDYQINKVLENLSPTIKAKVQEGNSVNFGNLYERLNQQIKNGELDAANMTFAKMAELNPKMAAALQPKMKRAWDANAIEQNFQNKLNFYKKDPTLTERQAFNMAMYNSIFSPAEQYEFFGTSTPSKKRKSTSNSSGGAGTTNNGTLGSMFGGYDLGNNNFKYVIEEINKLKSLDELTPAEEQRLKDLEDTKEDAEIISGTTPVTPQWIARKADNLINASNGNDAYVEDGLAQMFGRGSYMYNVGMERLKTRRLAQADTGYDVDTYWDEDAIESSRKKNTEKERQSAAEEKQQEYDYAAENETGIAKWANDKTKEQKKALENMTFSEIANKFINWKPFGNS